MQWFQFSIFFVICKCVSSDDTDTEKPVVAKSVVTLDRFVRWPGAVIPFYIEKQHFDGEQRTYILSSLSLLSFKTCLRFVPILSAPGPNTHAVVFQNHGGIKKCDVDNRGHPVDGPHYVTLGYECLQSPNMELKLLQALGLPLEHTRPIRDLYIDVQPENIESGYLELFTKDEDLLPEALQILPYDLDSATHFSERQFSRNGHRTIIIRDQNFKQQRTSYSAIDLRKIEIIYGEECLKRDRMEKAAMCQTFPKRRNKRSANYEINGRKIHQNTNLRVNRDIGPEIKKNILEELGLDSKVNDTVDEMYKHLLLAFTNAVKIYCNNTEPVNHDVPSNGFDVFHIKAAITKLVVKMVDYVKNDERLCSKPELADAYFKEKLLSGFANFDEDGTENGNNRDKDAELLGREAQTKVDSVRETMKFVNDLRENVDEKHGESKKHEKVVGNVQLETYTRRSYENDENAKSKDGRKRKETFDERALEMFTDSEEAESWTPVIVNLTKENLSFYNDRKWPKGVVRYIIEEDDRYDTEDLRTRLSEVNRILMKKTCVRLQELRSEDEGKRHRDYLVIDTSPDYITGRVGGRQQFGSVELFRGAQHRQHAAMMVMAMLGFYFEVARHDRDDHIRVHYRHIRPNKLHHFEKIRDEATFQLPYDYESATHPAWQFWRKADRTGISSVATYKNLDPDGSIMKSLGQHPQLLSELDIVKINSVYGVECFKDQIKRREAE